MKKLFPVLLIASIFMISCDDEVDFQNNCLPSHLQNDVIYYFPFGNGSIDDASGYSSHLTNSSSAVPTTDKSGNPNCAYQFDNTGTSEEFLSTQLTDELDGLDEFSISVWYYPVASSSKRLQGMVSRNDTIPTSCPDRRGEWSLSLYDCKKAVFGHDNSVWANLDINLDCDAQEAILDSVWHHAVVVKNDDQYKIYYNGILADSDTGNGGCNDLRISQDIGDLYIGKNFTGKLDDIIIYKRALSDQDVKDLYELDVCCE